MRWYGSLRRSGEIAYVRRAGRHAGGVTLSAYAAAAVAPGTQVCITVAKTVGDAVERNLVRRRIRGALDAAGAVGAGLRLVIVARPGAASAPYAQIETDVRSVLARFGNGVSPVARSGRTRAGRPSGTPAASAP